jgi:hypothetical protein
LGPLATTASPPYLPGSSCRRRTAALQSGRVRAYSKEQGTSTKPQSDLDVPVGETTIEQESTSARTTVSELTAAAIPMTSSSTAGSRNTPAICRTKRTTNTGVSAFEGQRDLRISGKQYVRSFISEKTVEMTQSNRQKSLPRSLFFDERDASLCTRPEVRAFVQRHIRACDRVDFDVTVVGTQAHALRVADTPITAAVQEPDAANGEVQHRHRAQAPTHTSVRVSAATREKRGTDAVHGTDRVITTR